MTTTHGTSSPAPTGILPRIGLNRALVALAFRELRGGIRGFGVFVACVALGVAVIAGVGALSDAMRAGFEKQGEILLGGDVAIARPHRRAEPAELTWIAQRGRVSETATLRAMARRTDGAEQVLVELKGIDNAYPLAGELALSPAMPTATALANDGAAVDEILLERLQVRLGDRISVGKREVEVRAIITAEPDKISDRLTFGPRLIVSIPTLDATGLVEPGALVRWRYAMKLADGAATSRLLSFREAVAKDLPDAGFTVADRRDPSPQVTRTLERLRQFLTLIGLTALLIGGVGVANAVAAFIDRRRKVIATFKSVGASSRQIFALHLIQVMLIAALGIAIGLAIGLLLPIILTHAIGDALPIRAELTVRPWSLAIATIYGILVALLFTLWPLGRAGEIRAAVLFRDDVAPQRVWPRPAIVAAIVATGAALLALAAGTSDSARLAFYFCAGIAAIFAIFLLLGTGLVWLVRCLPRPRRPELALALSSIGAPDGLTRSVILSLGSGLSLLVGVALVDHSIVDELRDRMPKNSPNFFVLDLPSGDLDGFAKTVTQEVPEATVSSAPMLRGRIVRLNGKPSEESNPPPQAQWVLRGDRGLTFSDEIPEGSRLVAGDWWPKGYDGEPLVSFEADLARLLGLKIGDTMTVNVLGRNITAKIANLREVKWESLSINFVVVFSPNTLRGAPHNLLATISLPKTTPIATEAAVARQIGKAYPAVTAIRVKDALNSFDAVFKRIMTAVRTAASVTLAAGALVLAGALATAQRRRTKQAVIVKVLGATRRRILATHAAEYLILAATAAGIAVLLGGIAAWATVTRIMDVPFAFSWGAVAQSLAVATALILLLGGLNTWRILRAPPVPYLRSE